MKKFIAFYFWISGFICGNVYSQVTIASEDFENTLTLFSKTGPGTFYSGLSGGFTSPFNSPYAALGTYAYGLAGGIDTLTSGIINTSAYTSVQLTMRLASFATNLSGGNDINDYVRIEISPDDGVHYYPTEQVTGNLNAWWSYSGGIANASTSYDGDPTIVTFSPASGGNRTTDGYSTITISSLPESIKLRIRIIIRNDVNPSGELWLIDRFEIKGNSVVGPLLTIYPLALSNFYTVTGNASAEQTYEVSGSSLTNDITVNPLSGYEVSTSSGSGFGSSVTLTQSGGIVSATTIYVRLNAVTTGSYNGSIANMSTGATTKNVAVTGNVLVPEPTITSTVSFANITTTSMDVNFTGGNGEGRIVVMKQNSTVTGTPVDAINYTANNVFGSGNTIASGEYVVYNGTGSTVNVTGLTLNRTYYVAVFEYSDGGLAAARNYYANPGTGNAGTLALNQGLELSSVNTLYKIDFDNTVPRVNNGAFAGVNINTTAASGELNSNAWSIQQSFSGSAVFGSNINSGGGVSSVPVTTGTFYAFETSPGNRAFGVQPVNGTFMDPGMITLRIQNNTGDTIKKLAISYKYYVLNNSNSGFYSEFGYSTNNVTYATSVIQDTTIETADASPVWRIYLMSKIITGLSIPTGDNFYFRWVGLFYLSGGENDEVAWDDISVVANPTTVFPRIAGSVEEMYVAGPVQLSGNTTVTGNVTLAGQNIELGDYDLTVAGNANSVSSGYLQTNGTGSVTLNNVTTARLVPLGVTTYNPLTISNGSGLNWTARLSNGIGNVLPPNNTDRAVLRTWTITPSTNPPPSGANLTFGYNDGDPTQLGISYNNAENVQVWHYNGIKWSAASIAITPTGTPGNSRSVTLSNWSQYSSFAIANLSGPLPVVFGLVKAKQTTGGVKISWENLTEENISFYRIEHSADGRTFTAIGQVLPALNNSSKAVYDWLDVSPYSKDNFYRIAAVEIDGKNVYSMIARIKPGNSSPGILIYPNPVHGSQSYLQLSDIPKGSYELSILTIGGQQVYKNSLSHDGGSVSMPLEVAAVLKPGFYIMRLRDRNISLQTNFIYR